MCPNWRFARVYYQQIAYFGNIPAALPYMVICCAHPNDPVEAWSVTLGPLCSYVSLGEINFNFMYPNQARVQDLVSAVMLDALPCTS